MALVSASLEHTSGFWWTVGISVGVFLGVLGGLRVWQLWPRRADRVRAADIHDWPAAVYRRVEAWEAAERHVATRWDALPAAGMFPERRATI
jgi:hypothetical protein